MPKHKGAARILPNVNAFATEVRDEVAKVKQCNKMMKLKERYLPRRTLAKTDLRQPSSESVLKAKESFAPHCNMLMLLRG